MDKIGELLTRGVVNIIPRKEELLEVLRSEKKLNIYLGIDPTSPHIHLGHSVDLRKLQAFADLGHHVTFLIGDFTALIGDTSDKDSERPLLNSKQIEDNFQTYKKQAEKILDFSKVKVLYNSQWLAELNFMEVIKLCRHFSAGDFLGRELIRKRLKENKRVGLHEFFYPVTQGYDSYKLQTDIQIGGTDQTFNMQAGRTLIKDLDKRESFILATEFLMGTDARKMSKSWGNAIWLDDKPFEMYRKIMAIEDSLIVQYYTLATNVPLHRIEEIKDQLEHGANPMGIKKELAREIVTQLHSDKAAKEVEQQFEKKVQKKELPENIASFSWHGQGSLVDFLVESELAESRANAKRLIEQDGITLDGDKIEQKPNDPFMPDENQIVGVGKRRFMRIRK